MRDFKNMDTDAIYALWDGYKRTDFGSYSPLNVCIIHSKIAIRLTPKEIIQLCDEIFIRLLEKEGYEPKKDYE